MSKATHQFMSSSFRQEWIIRKLQNLLHYKFLYHHQENTSSHRFSLWCLTVMYYRQRSWCLVQLWKDRNWFCLSLSWSMLVSIVTSRQETFDILRVTSKEQEIIKNLRWFLLKAAFGDMSEAVHWSQFLLTCPFKTLHCKFDLGLQWLDIQCLKRPATVLTDFLWHSFSLPLLLIHVLYTSLGCTLLCV